MVSVVDFGVLWAGFLTSFFSGFWDGFLVVTLTPDPSEMGVDLWDFELSESDFWDFSGVFEVTFSSGFAGCFSLAFSDFLAISASVKDLFGRRDLVLESGFFGDSDFWFLEFFEVLSLALSILTDFWSVFVDFALDGFSGIWFDSGLVVIKNFGAGEVHSSIIS